MPVTFEESDRSTAGSAEHVSASIASETAAECLKQVPCGALVLASLSVGLLFIGWLAFYFLLFIPRGSVG